MVGVGITKNIYTAAVYRNHAVRRCERSSCQAVQLLNEGWAQFTNQASGTFQVLINSILNVRLGVLGWDDGYYLGIRAGGCHQGLNSLSSAHSLLWSHACGAQFLFALQIVRKRCILQNFEVPVPTYFEITKADPAGFPFMQPLDGCTFAPCGKVYGSM